MHYNYQRFSASDYDFNNFQGPKTGEIAKDFTAETIDGKAIKLSDFKGSWVVLETGSFTCPMYVGIMSKMNQLAEDFPDTKFLVLYIREAHPGTNIGGHANMDEKRVLAKRLVNEEPENRTVIIDDLEGSIHKSLGALPNMAYIFNPKGVVVHKSTWADPEPIRKILLQKDPGYIDPVELREPPQKPIRTLLRILPRAGRHAIWDLLKGIPRLEMNYRQIRRHNKLKFKS